jgi:hypothetical protein
MLGADDLAEAAVSLERLARAPHANGDAALESRLQELRRRWDDAQNAIALELER